ncbi:BadF/BadG/BcrA/BcrD ATPase family protein [Streptomyces sp. MP131-18]|uniref:N-acetylglucosamine kinase n=1 Tax=Streptomyces sp. MP131-18 TaxID=1857892 RepID=UPI0009C4575D|nr:BadF/BadG/BcrA/BcrD ATPase family protein [Streptomyces sp. MP131-18]ONK16178.1 BadF/BadG/BcrA/BcrD ATPase family protein [Streptomyces sp. MP131-18]
MNPAPGGAAVLVLGVDSGGSGLRVALATAHPDRGGGGTGPVPRRHGGVVTAEPVRTGAAGIDAGHLLGLVVPAAEALLAEAGADRVDAVCVGAAGMASLGGQLRAELPDAFAARLGARRVALAADAVTGYAGALGVRPGAVVAAGTGMIALGTDLRGWRRADGWGHLLGDCGSGAWIGRAGLEAALRAHDGREGGSARLLARAEAAFGPPEGLPQQVYPRTDRPAVLASFAPEVGRCAAAGDAVAGAILRRAAEEIARAAEAVCPSAAGSEVALTGGLFGMGEPLRAPLLAELARRLPHAAVVPAAGGPLDGALLVAAGLTGAFAGLPRDRALLHVVDVPSAGVTEASH